MSAARTWEKIPFTVGLECCEIRLYCESSGYYDPGYLRDRNGDGCPPCGEDVRNVQSIEIELADGRKIETNQPYVVEWFSQVFGKQIEDHEVEQ